MTLSPQPQFKIPGLERGEFEIPRAERNSIVWSIEGESKTLKSTFPLSGPSPQVVFDIDDRLEGVVNKWMRGEFGHPPKKIGRLPLRLPKVDIRSRKPDESARREAELEWTKFLKHYQMALESSDLPSGGIRVISIDDATELADLRILAEFGRLTSIEPWQRGQANLEIGTLMREGQKHNASVVWIHMLKDEYMTVKRWNEKQGKEVEDSVKTGRRILDGYKRAYEATQVCLRTELDAKGKGSITVVKSGLNYATNLQKYTSADWGEPDDDDYLGPFAFIAKKQYPRTKYKDWMDADAEADENED